MNWRFLLPVILLASSAGWADSSGQDFWNGGPGTPGPVSYWSNAFDSCSEIDYSFAHSIQLMISNTLHWIQHTGLGANEMEVLDIDEDGDYDVVGCEFSHDCLYLWENLDGCGMSWAKSEIADSLDADWALDAADIDKDGDTDFAVASADGPHWVEHEGTTWTRNQIGSLHCEDIRAADIDGDNDVDVVTASENPVHQVVWWENADGVGGSWQSHLIASSYPFPNQVRTADMDGDGDEDVLLSQDEAPNVVWMENLDGFGDSWAPHIVCQYLAGEYLWLLGLEAADLDLDGDMDVVAAGSDPMPEGAVVWIENLDGLGTSWLKHPIDNSLIGANSVDTADLDGDGDLDVMATSGSMFGWDENLVIWYENTDGQGTSWNGHVLDTTTADACDVTSVDMDLDGDPDVVAADGFIGMRWYEFSRAASGWLESSVLDPPGGSQEQWTDLSWDATVPSGTILTFQVRASNDPADMGAWSPAFAVPGSLAPYLPDPAWYFQYRVNMVTGVPPITPVLDEVLVQYDPVGIEGQPEADEPTLTVLSGNPSLGIVILDVCMPEAGLADLLIYDIAGRLVEDLLAGQIEAGHHQLAVTDLPTGCYRAVLTTDGFSTETRLTVLR